MYPESESAQSPGADISANRHWLPLHIGDYLAETRHLTPHQRDCYISLQCEYWTKGSLPQDDAQLARIAGMSTSQWRKTKSLIQPLFVNEWKHLRLDAEMERVARKTARGRAGAEKRWQKEKDGSIDQASAKHAPSNGPGNAKDDAPATRYPLPDSSLRSESAPPAPKQPTRNNVIQLDAAALWSEGVAILKGLGLTDAQARTNIGHWRKQTAQNDVHILKAIKAAQAIQTRDPVPYVTAALKESSSKLQGGRDDAIAEAYGKAIHEEDCRGAVSGGVQ